MGKHPLSSLCARDTLEMLRTLLHHLEDAPAYDPANTEFVKRIIRYRIRAVESIYRLAVEQASLDSAIPTLPNRSANAPGTDPALQSGKGKRHRQWMGPAPVLLVSADSAQRLKPEGMNHAR